MTKWHAHVAHVAKHTNMVGDPGPGPPLNPALCCASGCRLGYVLSARLIETTLFMGKLLM